MKAWSKVLVLGADQHQGLAVIRGLGLAGIPVAACGVSPRSIGFYSRYATETWRYAPPSKDRKRFLDDVAGILSRSRPGLVIPAVESTLVVLNEARELVEGYATLAAPAPEVLEYAIDKGRTLRLAERLGVPVPRTVRGETVGEILAKAGALRFPVAIKPRGHGLHFTTAHTLDFKVRYARDQRELEQMVRPFEQDAKTLLVQEYVQGVGRCVAAVCRHGEALALFAYSREREYPLSGGVSVVRMSIPLDERLAGYVTSLLGEIRWHGVAMVEFKYDPAADRYTLMEINGRFQASTALSLDAGINLPYLAACVYGAGEPGPAQPYRVGVVERWLRGDLLVVRDALTTPSRHAQEIGSIGDRPSRAQVLRQFLHDFRPGMHYDEFKWHDWRPGLVEAVSLIAMVLGWAIHWTTRAGRRALRALGRRLSTAVRSPTQRSMRRGEAAPDLPGRNRSWAS